MPSAALCPSPANCTQPNCYSAAQSANGRGFPSGQQSGQPSPKSVSLCVNHYVCCQCPLLTLMHTKAIQTFTRHSKKHLKFCRYGKAWLQQSKHGSIHKLQACRIQPWVKAEAGEAAYSLMPAHLGQLCQQGHALQAAAISKL